MSCAMIALWLMALSAADEPNAVPAPEEKNLTEWELNVYLPQQILWDNYPITLLQSQGEDSYMVTLGEYDFDAIGAGRISFRNSKNWADKSEHIVPHGEILPGQDAGDNWVSFLINVRRQWVDEPAEDHAAEKSENAAAEERPAKEPAAEAPDGWKLYSKSTWDNTLGKWIDLADPTNTTTMQTQQEASSDSVEDASCNNSEAAEGVKDVDSPVNSKALQWEPTIGKWIKQGEPDNSNAAEDERVARGEWVRDGITYQYVREDRYAREDRYVKEKLSDIVNSKGARRVRQNQDTDSGSYYVSFDKLGKKAR